MKMGWVKRNMALVVFLISTAIILTIFFSIFRLQNNSTLYLKDIKGDRKALSDIKIIGYLQDKYHAQRFDIEGGELSHEFIYYDSLGDIKFLPVKYANGAEDDKYRYWYNYRYEIAPDANIRREYTENKIQMQCVDGKKDAIEKITMTYADKIDLYMDVRYDWLDIKPKKKMPDPNYLYFKTGVQLEREYMDFVFEEKKTYYPEGGLAAEDENFQNAADIYRSTGSGMVVLNGSQYFTVLTQINPYSHQRYTGENGIFKAEQYDNWWGDKKEKGKVRKIASIPMDENDIQVLGLHGVEDKLVVVMLVDGVLTLRAFEPQTGKMLDEISVPQLDISKQPIRYDEYVDGDIIHLNIITNNNPVDELQVVSIQVGDRLTLKSYVDGIKFENQMFERVPAISWVDDKLVVAGILKDIDEQMESEYLYPKRFMIFVFDGMENSSALIYQGEIITDADEDNNRYRGDLREKDQYGYNYYESRNLDFVVIKEGGFK
jgi:hypothetical protein